MSESTVRPIKLLTRFTLLSAAFLFTINALVIRELFRVEYTRQWGSIEAAYISISRYILEHWHDFSWFPLWYCGIPYQNTYPPLLHFIVAADAWLLHISPAHAHHATSAVFYCLEPVALFFLVYAMSERLGLSLAAALIFSFSSPSALILHLIRHDMESFRSARRFQALIVYGEGPHITAITLLLVAILMFHLALERRRFVWILAAILSFAAVVLTNWLGTFALAIAALCYLLARSSSDHRIFRMLGISTGIAAIAYCLIAPWIPPSTLEAVRRNAQFVIGSFPIGPLQYELWALVLVGCAVLRRIFVKFGVSLLMQFAGYFLWITGALTVPYDSWGVYLMPQSDRYHLEFEIPIAIVLAFGLGPILLRLFQKRETWLVVFLLLIGALQVRTYRRYARGALKPGDVYHSVEYQTATFLQQNLPEQRVYATGSVQFWLNAFSDSPQVGGGFGQGVINPELPKIHYGIPFTERDGERTALWLRLIGAQAIVTSGPGGRDAYPQNWRDPDKFDGVLPEIWRVGADRIYSVPQRTRSLAHVIEPSDVVDRAPINVEDVEPVRKLGAALENPLLPEARFAWRNPGAAHIDGILKPDQLLFIQLSYHPGWMALVNQSPRRIFKDGLGFLVIDPKCDGPCSVELVFDGGSEMHRANILRLLGIAAALLWMWWWARPRLTSPARSGIVLKKY